jgi:hypothetical protein
MNNKNTFTPAAKLRFLADTLEKGGATYGCSERVGRLACATEGIMVVNRDADAAYPSCIASGYAVSVRGGRAFEWMPEIKLCGLGHYVDVFCLELDRVLDMEEPDYIGTWIDDETLYIDPVVLVLDLDAALALARENGQQAIYGFAERAVIEVPVCL